MDIVQLKNIILIKNENEKYAFDIVTYVLLKIDDLIYDAMLVRYNEKSLDSFLNLYGKKVLGNAFEFFDELKRNKVFFSEDGSEGLPLDSAVKVGEFSLPPVHSCNLRCSYCFAEAGNNYKDRNRYFTSAQIKKILKKIYFELMPECEQYRINFVSGGEPLLNFKLIKSVRDVANDLYRESGKNLSMWLCTNGTLLTKEIVSELKRNSIKWGLSIDGPREIHDAVRKDKDGGGTYNIIMKNIENINYHNRGYNVLNNAWSLVVITSKTKSLVEIVKHHYNIGFRSIQMKPVRMQKNSEFAITTHNVQNIMNMYSELFDFYKKEWDAGRYKHIMMTINDFDFSGKIFRRLALEIHVKNRCMFGNRKVSIQANGNIYPCDSFVGMEEFCLGNIYKEIDKIKINKNISLFKCEECSNCWARYLCGGGCWYNSYIVNQNIFKPDSVICSLKKYVVLQNIFLINYFSTTNFKLYKDVLHLIKLKESAI